MSSKVAMFGLAVIGMIGAADVEAVRMYGTGWMGVSQGNSKLEEKASLMSYAERQAQRQALLAGKKSAAASTESQSAPSDETEIAAPVFKNTGMPIRTPSPELPRDFAGLTTLDRKFEEFEAPAPVAVAVAVEGAVEKSSVNAAEEARRAVMNVSRVRPTAGNSGYKALYSEVAPQAAAAPVATVNKVASGLSGLSLGKVATGVFGTKSASMPRRPLLERESTNSSDNIQGDNDASAELTAADRTSTIQGLKNAGKFTSLQARAAMFGGKPVEIERTTTFGRGTKRGGVKAARQALLAKVEEQ